MVSDRIVKVNKNIQRTLSTILLEEADVPKGVLVTISRVETTRNLRFSTVWIYIAPPARAEETLELLKPQMYDIQGSLNRAIALHPFPRIRFQHDNGLDHADAINIKLDELKKESGK